MTLITAGGHTIACEMYGDPKDPPVFLLHGIGACRIKFEAFGPALAKKGFYAIAYDNIGHGDSDHPVSYSLDDMAHTLLSLIPAFGYESADVYGHSMGSYVVIRAAQIDPSLIRHVIAAGCKSSTRYCGPAGGMPELRRKIAAGIYSCKLDAMVSPFISPELRSLLMEEELHYPYGTGMRTKEELDIACGAVASFDLTPDAAGMTTPVLFLQGRYDLMNPPDAVDELLEKIPNAQLAVLERSGHKMDTEEMERAVEITAEFFRTGRPSQNFVVNNH